MNLFVMNFWTVKQDWSRFCWGMHFLSGAQEEVERFQAPEETDFDPAPDERTYCNTRVLSNLMISALQQLCA